MLFSSVFAESKRKKSVRERLDGSDAVEEEIPVQVMSGELSPTGASIKNLLRGMGVAVDQKINALELQFARAGIDSKDGPVYYLFFQRVLSFFIGLFALYLILTGDTLTKQAIGVFVAGIAVFGPKMYLDNKTAKRAKLLTRAFPDTLDLLLICVESGLALDAALAKVCNELARAYPEMTGELNRTRLELALLNDRPRALQNLADRTGGLAFRSLVVALIQSERFGTSLTDTLRVLSEDFRLQRLSDAEAKAARLPVLLTVPLIFMLMPAFMMIVLGPAIVKMMN